MSNLEPKGPPDKIKLSDADIERISKAKHELEKLFLAVFDNPQGQKVLEWLDEHARSGFPDYNNVNRTYSQIGKQKLIEKIREITNKPKGVKK